MVLQSQYLFFRRKWTLISIAVIVPVGFLTKFYSGPWESWVNNSLGGILYVIFWSLVFFLVFPRTRVWKITGIVLLTTCVLECLQLWHPPFLESIRSTFLGATLLGNSFSWLDLVHYLVGFTISSGILHILLRKEAA
jgi:hypothetical protein